MEGLCASSWKVVMLDPNHEAMSKALELPAEYIEKAKKVDHVYTFTCSADKKTLTIKYKGAMDREDTFTIGEVKEHTSPFGKKIKSCFDCKDGKMVETHEFESGRKMTVTREITGNKMCATAEFAGITTKTQLEKC